jgi:hypothetical protein
VGYTDLTATNSDDSTPTFRVDFEVTPIEPEAAGQKDIGSCWKGIIGSSVLVWGFPIAPRSLTILVLNFLSKSWQLLPTYHSSQSTKMGSFLRGGLMHLYLYSGKMIQSNGI